MLTSLGIGGAERQAISIAERMAARGHEVVVIVMRPREACEWATWLRIERLQMTRLPFALARGVIRARRVVRDFRPDVVHSHTCPANIAARVLFGLGAATSVVSTIHNVYEGGRYRTLAYRMTNRLAVHTTAVSQAVADQCGHFGVVAAGHCSVLTNGIDVGEFAPRCEGTPRGMGLPEASDDFIWLAAGRDVPAKDFDNLLAAFALLNPEFPKTQLWIAGQPSAFRRYAAGDDGGARSLSRVHWLGIRSDMPQVLAACDGFVLSSAWEGMPLVVGEAMAMEKPAVATDVGGVRELVGETGVVVPARSAEQLGAGMLRVMRASESRRRAMGHAGRERISQFFNMDRKADEWEALYERIRAD
jgi:glycosyltransferase involved in cell wall biosynthesis